MEPVFVLKDEIAAPERYSTENAGFIGNDPCVWLELECDSSRVAAPNVEAVVIRQGRQDSDHFLNAGVPFLFADPMALAISRVFVVCFLFVKRVMGHLQVRHQFSVPEERGSDTGSQRDHELKAPPFDGRQPLHIGVVDEANRFLEFFTQRVGERKPAPYRRSEVRGGDDGAIAHHAGEPNGNAVISWERFYQCQ